MDVVKKIQSAHTLPAGERGAYGTETLDALAVVDDPTPAIQQLDDVTTRKTTASGRGVRAFNPLSPDDTQLFKAMMAGEHRI